MVDQTFLEWPFFEDRHRQLSADLRAWCRENIGMHGDHETDADTVSSGFVQALGQAGFNAHTVPAPWGGASETLDVRSLAICRETLAYYHGLADFAFVMQGLGSGPISMFGTEEQRSKYLPPVAAGTAIAALGMTEDNAGSDSAAIETRAEDMGDHWLLNGHKTFISNGGIADQYCVFAVTDPELGTKGISCLIVEATDPGFSVPQRIDVMAPHPLGRLQFDNCRIPKDRLVGQRGQGFKVAMANLDVFRTTVGAAALGFARRALDEALARTEDRQMFGQRQADFQLTQIKIGEMATEVDASALMVYRSAWTRDVKGVRVTREASMAKNYATEAAQRIIDSALQMWGGLGVTVGTPVENLYREIRALRIYEGATEVNQMVIAKATYQGFERES